MECEPSAGSWQSPGDHLLLRCLEWAQAHTGTATFVVYPEFQLWYCLLLSERRLIQLPSSSNSIPEINQSWDSRSWFLHLVTLPRLRIERCSASSDESQLRF